MAVWVFPHHRKNRPSLIGHLVRLGFELFELCIVFTVYYFICTMQCCFIVIVMSFRRQAHALNYVEILLFKEMFLYFIKV